jgi:hypothetical protein
MSRTAYATTIVHWGNMDTKVQARKPALDHLEPLRAQLEAERVGLVEATNRQSALKTEAQSASRAIEEHLLRGNDLATRLRDAVRAHYGRSAEDLNDFGIQPRRARPASIKAKSKKSVETGPNPDQTAAAPETDGTT